MTEKDIEQVREAALAVGNAARNMGIALRKAVVAVASSNTMFHSDDFLESIAYCYADSKTVHLAKYGKNKRIRNKNHKKAMCQGLRRYLNEGK